MARQITPFGKVVFGILKWVGIPLIAMLIGLYIIGPNIGSKDEPKNEPAQQKPNLSTQGQKFQSVREPGH